MPIGVTYVPGLYTLLAEVVVASLALAVAGFGAKIVFLMVALLTVLLLFGTEPLSRVIARLGYSIRWKFEIGIALIAVAFLIVSIVSFGEMKYMHDDLHKIQDLGLEQPTQVLPAVHELEDTHHGLLFSLTPYFDVLGVMVDAVLGGAMAWSVIVPIRRMRQAMRTIASGDFSQRLEVDNNDEMGDLAAEINDTGRELGTLQAAVLTEERAHAARERSARVTLAEEEERRRISGELHDNLGPSLAAIGNRLRACQPLVRTDPAGVEKQLGEVADGIKGHIREIRELIYSLKPQALDQLGLVAALRQLVERFGTESGVRASFVSSEDIALGPLAELTVFRVVQECLNNVQVHANATQVEVKLQYADGTLEVTVLDEGRGFDPSHMAPVSTGNGVGFLSMPEREELLGGTFSVDSSPGNGCKAVLLIPQREVKVGAHSTPAG